MYRCFYFNHLPWAGYDLLFRYPLISHSGEFVKLCLEAKADNIFLVTPMGGANIPSGPSFCSITHAAQKKIFPIILGGERNMGYLTN